MAIQTSLFIILVGLIITLAILLYRRIKAERTVLAVIDRITPDQFAEFIRLNASNGSIQLIARKVSDFLKNSFGCERIIFMRKQRAHLELNYYHGIRAFRRDEFRFRYSGDLADNLKQEAFPRPTEDLERMIPGAPFGRLKHHQFDQFFPIFWRDNLYGIYFISSTMTNNTPAFKLMIGSIAQALSAAYHIKWHEARYERIEKQRSTAKSPGPAAEQAESAQSELLKLIKNRQSDSLIPQIGQLLKKELELDDMAILYEPVDRNGPIQVWGTGRTSEISSPDRESFLELFSKVPDSTPLDLKHSGNNQENEDETPRLLNGLGLSFAARFPISSRRRGVLVWNSSDNPSATCGRLAPLARVTRDLVENAEAYERMEAMSNTDGLTGLANQRYFHKRLAEEVNRATRYKRHLSLIIFDLDNLKGINDSYGHLAGNAVLKRMGQILRSSIRAIDVISRYGGDEFCVIMPEADEEMCRRFMERLRTKISSSKFTLENSGKDIHCTVSQGGAIFPNCGRDSKSLMHAADIALLEAKGQGRDRSVMAAPATESAS